MSYVYRNVNAVVYPDLAKDLGLAANSLGLLTSTYLFAFAAAQLPIGVALDRYGPRKVQIPMLLIAAVGAVLFANVHSLSGLMLARGLIGLGVAGSLMAAIKASSLWLPVERLPLSTAVLLAVGGMGAMASTSPVQAALDVTDWRGIFLLIGALTVLVSLLILFVVPEHPKKQHIRLSDMARDVAFVYGSWRFWRLVLYSVFASATYMAVQGLWLGPWLRDVGQLSRAAAADVLFASTAAMVSGSLCFGWLINSLCKRGVSPILVCGLGICVFLGFQSLMVFNLSVNPWLVALGFCFFGASAAMNYAVVAQAMPAHLTGRVSTSFNLVIFLLAFVIQWGLGSLINLWPATDGVSPPEAYQCAFGVALALQVPGIFLWLSFRPWRRGSR